MVGGWVLKADIRHYFPSIDHEVLMKLLRRKIADERVLSLLKKIIEAYVIESGRGMPLGALTSQLFANVYLNPLDHFIKEKLRVKFYLRYLDDFVLLHSSRQQLEEWKYEIEKFLSSELKLQLHPEKTSIFPLHHGVPLLGFRCFYYYRLLKKSNLRHFLRKLESIEDDEERQKSLEGWLAHAAWGIRIS
jgi:retron-type reverse transcriptase